MNLEPFKRPDFIAVSVAILALTCYSVVAKATCDRPVSRSVEILQFDVNTPLMLSELINIAKHSLSEHGDMPVMLDIYEIKGLIGVAEVRTEDKTYGADAFILADDATAYKSKYAQVLETGLSVATAIVAPVAAPVVEHVKRKIKSKANRRTQADAPGAQPSIAK